MAKSFVILDPGMRQHAGHYFEFNMALADAASKAGYNVTIYAHKEWQAQDKNIIAYFSAGVGQGSRLHGLGHRMLSILPPFLRKILFAPARFFYRMFKEQTHTENGFTKEVSNISFPDAAIILCPSSSYADILAMIAYCASTPNEWRFVLRQKPQDKIEEKALEILKQKTLPDNMRMLADTNDLAVWLNINTVPAALMPIPMKLPPYVYTNPKPHEIYTFALLGPARKEKGFLLMPDLICAFADDLKQNKVRFFIQTTLIGGQAPEPETETTIAELKKLQRQLPNIILKDGDLTEDEFYRALCEASCLLVPYDRKRYEARSSGLLVQSFLCGRPAIVPRGTWMADQIPDFMRDFIWDDDLEKICKTALSNQSGQLWDGALIEFRDNWRRIHSPAGTFETIIAGGQSL